MGMSKPNLVPYKDVLAWLQANHPELHQSAHIEREWVWITYNLKGDAHREIRDSIKRYGFIYARKGHTLPTGLTAYWAHHGVKPVRFRRKGRASPGAWSRGPADKTKTALPSDAAQRQAEIDEALAALAALTA